MDQRLIKALEASKNLESLNTIKAQIFEKFEEKLQIFYNGGEFVAGIDLLRTVGLYISKDATRNIILDQNNIPIVVDDLEGFYNLIWNTYQTALLEYESEYSNIVSTLRNKSV